MRVARLSSCGCVEKILHEDLCPLSAEMAAHEVAMHEPGIFFGVLPDDADELLCVARCCPQRSGLTALSN
jgi:hypothetical protein